MTMLNLLVAGIHYEMFDFSLPADVFAHKIKHKIFKINYEIPRVSLVLWEDIITNIKARNFYEEAGYSIELLDMLDWLRNFDIETHSKKTVAYAKTKRTIISFAKKIPFLDNAYQKSKRLRNLRRA